MVITEDAAVGTRGLSQLRATLSRYVPSAATMPTAVSFWVKPGTTTWGGILSLSNGGSNQAVDFLSVFNGYTTLLQPSGNAAVPFTPGSWYRIERRRNSNFVRREG